MIYGYARVSTSKKDEAGAFVQTTDLQVSALVEAGIPKTRIYQDRMSGKAKSRPGLDELINKVSAGDEIVVWKLDRLGRSARNLLEITEDLANRGVSIRSLQDGIDTKGAFGKFMLTILAAVAELERENISERVTAGMATAKRQGVKLGRRPVLTTAAKEDVLDSYRAGRSVSELARRYKIHRSTVYDLINKESPDGLKKQPRLTM